jgi:hypothetical protein
MALDPTAREANFKDSMKKYIVDNMWTIEKVPISFDPAMSKPKLANNMELTTWLNVRFGDFYRDDLSRANVEIRCCTRQDNEGFRLAQLCDKVMGYFTTIEGTGIKSIDFYRSYEAPTPWVKIGGIVVQDIIESGVFIAEDESKFKVLYLTLRFASKI